MFLFSDGLLYGLCICALCTGCTVHTTIHSILSRTGIQRMAVRRCDATSLRTRYSRKWQITADSGQMNGTGAILLKSQWR